MDDPIAAIRGGLLVSCQAPPGHPLDGTVPTVLLARCAAQGGAVGLRIDSAKRVRAVKEQVELPIIGIHKVRIDSGRPRITTEFRHAERLVEAGADIIAVEAAEESGPAALELIDRVRRELAVPVMADVSTFDEGKQAWETGADLVGSTLSGYTASTANGSDAPDLDLVEALSSAGVRTVAEGRLRTPDEAADSIRRGAWSVLVGTAITDPVQLTQWFSQAVNATSGRV